MHLYYIYVGNYYLPLDHFVLVQSDTLTLEVYVLGHVVYIYSQRGQMPRTCVADIRGEKDEPNSSVTVKSFIISFGGTLPPSPVYTHHSKRRREQTSPENAHKLRHIIQLKS